MSIKIDYTIEILYHFTCSQCHHWWSYAMMPTNNKMSLNIDGRFYYSGQALWDSLDCVNWI